MTQKYKAKTNTIILFTIEYNLIHKFLLCISKVSLFLLCELFPPVDLTSLCVSADFASKNPSLPCSLPTVESPENRETKGALPVVCTPTVKSVSWAMNTKLLTLRSLCVLSHSVLSQKCVTCTNESAECYVKMSKRTWLCLLSILIYLWCLCPSILLWIKHYMSAS